MKKLLLTGLMLCFASFVYAQEPAATETVTTEEAAPAEVITLNGTIIDNMCAGNKDAAALEEFVKTHPKSCALMPDCAASGYSIFADGQLSKFDADSSARIEEFLRKEDSSLQVTVTANKVGQDLSLVTIENQQ